MIIRIVLCGLFLCFAWFGLAGTYASFVLKSQGKIATGTCIDVTTTRHTQSKGGTRTDYHFLVEFLTADQKTVRTEVEPWFAEMRPGQEVEILYLSENPKHAQLNWSSSLWGFPALFSLFAILLGWGLLNDFRTARQHKRKK